MLPYLLQISNITREYNIQHRKKQRHKNGYHNWAKNRHNSLYHRLPWNLRNVAPFAPYRQRLSSVALPSAVDGHVLSGEWQFWPGQARSFCCLWTLQLLVQHRCLSYLTIPYPWHLKLSPRIMSSILTHHWYYVDWNKLPYILSILSHINSECLIQTPMWPY